MDYKKVLKSTNEFICEKCCYKSHDKSNYEKHLLTAKHKRVTEDYKKVLKSTEPKFACECGKEYKNRQGLYRHRLNCTTEKIVEAEPIPQHNGVNMNVIFELIKDNQEFKNMLIEQSKQTLELHKENNLLMTKLADKDSSITNNNNNNTTNNNQKFNLNFFLNETCKDAMNIQEFIENIKITFEELITICNDGFVDGVSDIFVKRLKCLEVNKRPIHCTDAKRETIYFKDQNIWNRGDKQNTELKNAIKKIEYKNVVALKQWCNDNPDSSVNNTQNNLLRDKIYLETLQGDERTREKIVKNISKEVIITKEI